MTDLADGFVLLVRKPAPEPWAAPGLPVAERVSRLIHPDGPLMHDSLDQEVLDALAAALRAAIEDAALVAEAMAFDAVAARIRRLKEDDR